jgi:Zn-dependent peptidase ImmA (M78 family)
LPALDPPGRQVYVSYMRSNLSTSGRAGAIRGERLRIARRRAGLSLRELERAVSRKISAQALSKYERGAMTPSSDVLLALSRALAVPVPYLLAVEQAELGEVEFRTKPGISGRDRARIEAAVLEWVERYLQLERILALDSTDWARPDLDPRPTADPEAAEGFADELRRAWRLGSDPIPDMTELLEDKGLKVLLEDLPGSVSGFSCLVERPADAPPVPVIIANRQDSLERRRLSLAHELAHILIDPAGMSPRTEELVARRFAEAVLMPREHVKHELGSRRHAISYRELIDMKRLYRVGGAALLARLRDLDVIDERTLTYAFQSVARNWRTQEPEELEPADHRGDQEPPRRLRRLCLRALAEKLITLPKAADLLREPIDAVEVELKGPTASHARHRQRHERAH